MSTAFSDQVGKVISVDIFIDRVSNFYQRFKFLSTSEDVHKKMFIS